MVNERLTVRMSRAVFDQIDRALGPNAGSTGNRRRPTSVELIGIEFDLETTGRRVQGLERGYQPCWSKSFIRSRLGLWQTRTWAT